MRQKEWIRKIAAVAIVILFGICGFLTWNDSQEVKVDSYETNLVSESKWDDSQTVDSDFALSFRNSDLLESHYEKHGVEMGFSSAQEYEAAANRVVENAASLHKLEKEDGDDVYYLEETNEFVIVSTDGYIRTYFCPEDGLEYYNRQ